MSACTRGLSQCEVGRGQGTSEAQRQRRAAGKGEKWPEARGEGRDQNGRMVCGVMRKREDTNDGRL